MAICERCEGEGRVWADGKAHYQSYTGPTMPCPDCNGINLLSRVQELEAALISVKDKAILAQGMPYDLMLEDLEEIVSVARAALAPQK